MCFFNPYQFAQGNKKVIERVVEKCNKRIQTQYKKKYTRALEWILDEFMSDFFTTTFILSIFLSCINFVENNHYLGFFFVINSTFFYLFLLIFVFSKISFNFQKLKKIKFTKKNPIVLPFFFFK